jgi:hypothetical protein
LSELQTDPAETNNVAAEKPQIVKNIKEIMESEHEFSESFPFDFELNN